MSVQEVTEVEDEIELIIDRLSGIECIVLGKVQEETKQSPGVVVPDNPFASGPWHDAD